MSRFRQVRRRLPSIALAAANMLLTSGILVIPTFLHRDQSETITFTISVLSAQAAQASVIQTNHALFKDPRPILVTGIVGSALVSLIPFAAAPIEIARNILTAAFAALLGAATGAIANKHLNNGDSMSYQAVSVSRTGIWALFITGFAIFNLPLAWGTAAAWAVMTFAWWRAARLARDSRIGASTVLVGVGAGLLYRNDVNVARGMADATKFGAWNVAITGYSLVQAIVGFIVVNELYSRRSQVLRFCAGNNVKAISAITVGVLAALAAATYVVTREPTTLSLITGMTLAAVSGVAVSLQAAIAHIEDRSAFVYAGGVAGFIVLIVCSGAGATPAFGIAVELLLSGLIVAVGIITNHRNSLLRKGGT